VTRGLLIANGVAAVVGAVGLTLLVRPAVARRLLRTGDGEAAGYALRIAGAMLFAAALFCAGFATMFVLSSQ